MDYPNNPDNPNNSNNPDKPHKPNNPNNPNHQQPAHQPFNNLIILTTAETSAAKRLLTENLTQLLPHSTNYYSLYRWDARRQMAAHPPPHLVIARVIE